MYAMHSHSFIPIKDCLLAPADLSGILDKVNHLLSRFGSERLPDQLTVRWNQDHSQIMLILHGGTPSLPKEQIWIDELSAIPNLTSLFYYRHLPKEVLSFSEEDVPLDTAQIFNKIYPEIAESEFEKASAMSHKTNNENEIKEQNSI